MNDSRNAESSRGGKVTGQLIKIEEERLHQHLGEIVRGTVEETLNELLEAEADRLPSSHTTWHTDHVPSLFACTTVA